MATALAATAGFCGFLRVSVGFCGTLLSLRAVAVTLAAQPAPRALGSCRDKKQPHPQRGPRTKILPSPLGPGSPPSTYIGRGKPKFRHR